MKKNTKKYLTYAGLAALAGFGYTKFVKASLPVNHEPPPPNAPPPTGTVPTIPPASSTFQLWKLTFDCADVEVTDLNDWKAGLGIPPHQMADTGCKVHIIVKDPNGIEKAHLVTATVLPRSSGNEFKTVYMQNDTVHNLLACTVYTGYCYVTNMSETASYSSIKTGQWRTRGCTV